MKRLIGMLLILGLGLIGPGAVRGQGGEMDCPAIVETALAATGAACAGMGRDQACYGHALIAAEAQPGVEDFVFTQAGDVVNVAAIRALWLGGMDVNAGLWGVGLLRLRADLPETLPGEAATVVLFGSVAVLRDDSAGPEYGPLQAFYLTTGLHDAPCAAAPDSGILIQTPQGGGTVTLRVNAVTVALGSTVYVQALPGGELVIYVLEGSARVEAFGAAATVPAGSVVRVPLDGNGTASGPPGTPEAFDAASLAALPVGLLDRAVVAGAAGAACTVTAGRTVNLRAGPGTTYPAQGQLAAGQSAVVDGETVGGDGMTWLRLVGGAWVRQDLVSKSGNCDNLPVVDLAAPDAATPMPQQAIPPNGTYIEGIGPAIRFMITTPTGMCAPSPIPYGYRTVISFGRGFATFEAAQAAMNAATSYVTVNGAVLPSVWRDGPTQNPDGLFNYETWADWGVPEPGTYTIVGYGDGDPWVCTVVVAP